MDFSSLHPQYHETSSYETDSEVSEPDTQKKGERTARFSALIDDPSFPCVGSKVALVKNAIQTIELADLGDCGNDTLLLDGLVQFAAELDVADPNDKTVRSFVALFSGPCDTGEERFESLLWSQLQRLHNLDVHRGNRWAEDVVNDPDDSKFSLSLAGHPFFVIGLHSGASRLARRFASPALVFNSHRQFEQLRADGRFKKMQAATRRRDMALQGSINPNLADFGVAGETRQYSGRPVGADWKCPFQFNGET